MTIAEIVIRNAKVLTMDRGVPQADWVAVAGDRIIALGFSGAEDALIGAQTRVIDAQGATVLPGLNDSHVHLFGGGVGLGMLDLRGLRGQKALSVALAAYRSSQPDVGFISAHSTDYGVLGHNQPITRHVLDALVPDLPFLAISVG